MIILYYYLLKFFVALSFCVNREITIKVITAKGIEMMPGLSKGIGADAGIKPYFSYIVGENRMIPIEDTIPTIIDQAIPFAVVFFQNRRNSMAGKFADAATANARPTRNETFIPLNKIPRIIAKTPTQIAEILPALTFALSVISTCKYLSIKIVCNST